MTQIATWPWVRTQIHPDARKAAWRVHNRLGWTLPGIYAFAIHAMLMTHSRDEVVRMMRDAVGAEQKLLEEAE